MQLYCKEGLTLQQVVQFACYELFIKQYEFYISSTGPNEFTVWFLRWPEAQDLNVSQKLLAHERRGNQLVLFYRANLTTEQVKKLILFIMHRDAVQKSNIYITHDAINGNVVWYWGRRDHSNLEL
ncbi:MAG: hypothetical protein ACOYUZ_03905 [Patescibacteria group bacterium]